MGSGLQSLFLGWTSRRRCIARRRSRLPCSLVRCFHAVVYPSFERRSTMAQPFLDDLKSLADRFAADSSGLECKHFFSGAVIYSAGTICATLTPAELAFKLSENTRVALIENGLAVELRYFENAPVKKEYVLFSNPDSLKPNDARRYFAEAIAFASKRNG